MQQSDLSLVTIIAIVNIFPGCFSYVDVHSACAR